MFMRDFAGESIWRMNEENLDETEAVGDDTLKYSERENDLDARWLLQRPDSRMCHRELNFTSQKEGEKHHVFTAAAILCLFFSAKPGSS